MNVAVAAHARNALADRIFFLKPSLYEALPKRRRGNLVLVLNLLFSMAGDPDAPMLVSQPEIVEKTGLGIATVRRVERALEDLGAIRVLHKHPGLRNGRALELVPLADWVPQVAPKGPRRLEPIAEEAFTAPESIVDNSASTCPSPINSSGQSDQFERNDPPSIPHTARARHSRHERDDQRERASPLSHARPMFAFLAKHCGVSNRRFSQALPRLERLITQLGAEAAWAEVGRVATVSKRARNQGAYAFACLFPEGSTEREGLQALLERDGSPGPLFQGGGGGAPPTSSAPAPRARDAPGSTFWTSWSPNAR